jgi:poly-gamma-glutamate synthesis protein (capsule biosynthesis protein)
MSKKLFFIIPVLFLIINSFAINPAQENESRIKIAAIGDLLMHIPVKLSAKMHNETDAKGKSLNNNGFNYLFSPAKHIFKNHDAVIANMEFPIVAPYKSKAFNFNCEPDIIPALKDSGINIVTVANNHTYDKRRKGLIETVKTLKKYNMPFIGAGENEEVARKGIIISKGNLKVGIIGYTGVFNIRLNKNNPAFPRVNDFYYQNKVLEDIKRMKSKVDFLVMSVHWGSEYTYSPSAKDRLLAYKYIDAGVDMIIGHGPHVLQYAEKYKAKNGRHAIIVYSLGNYISNQKFYYTKNHPVRFGRERDGIIFSANIVKKKTFGLTPSYTVFAESLTFIPTWTINNRIRKAGKYIIDIRTVPINEAVNQINTKHPLSKESLLRKKLLLTRLKEIEKVLFSKGVPEGCVLLKPEGA